MLTETIPAKSFRYHWTIADALSLLLGITLKHGNAALGAGAALLCVCNRLGPSHINNEPSIARIVPELSEAQSKVGRNRMIPTR